VENWGRRRAFGMKSNLEVGDDSALGSGFIRMDD